MMAELPYGICTQQPLVCTFLFITHALDHYEKRTNFDQPFFSPLVCDNTGNNTMSNGNS